MTCWAFFDEKHGETLKDHIMVGLKHIERRYIKRNYHYYLAKEYGTSEDVAEDLLRITYILHDSGKGLEDYQKRKTSFGGHQEFSAAIAYEVLNNYNEELRGMVACAILLHHHDWVKRESPSINSPVLNDECRALLKSYLDREIPKIVHPMPKSLIDSTLTKHLKGVCLLLVPLMVADNYAAIINRGGSGVSLLGKEVIESAEFY